MDEKNNTSEKRLLRSKKKWLILSIVSLFVVCLIGVIIAISITKNSNSHSADDEEKLQQDLSDYFSINAEIMEVASEYENDNGFTPYEKVPDTIEAVGEYAKELKTDGKVKDYEISDGDSVWIQFNNGVEYLFSPNVEGYDSFPISTYQPFLSTYPTDIQELSLESVDGAASNTVNTIKGYEFTINLDNESVSIEEIKNIGQNKVAIWHGHGVYNAHTHSTLATAMKLDKRQFTNNPDYIKSTGYTDDFLSGRIICHNSGYVLVGYKFFDKYLSSIDSSIIYLGACSSGKDDVLANSFINKGAKSVFANTDVIHTDYNLKMIASVFDGLVTANSGQQYNTVEKALELAKTKNGKVCCSKDPNTEVKLFGKEDTTLSDNAAETSTEKPTEAKHEYTAVELASKSLDEIIEIMGGDFQTEYEGEHLINYTSGGFCIFNNDTLPGFAFFVKPAEGYSYDGLADPMTDLSGAKQDVLDGKYTIDFLGVYGSGKYNDKISADMTYLEVSEVIGSYELLPLVGSAMPRQSIDSNATVWYDAGEMDEETIKTANPGIKGISVHPTKNQEATEPTNVDNSKSDSSDDEIKSLLTSDKWILREVYEDDVLYEGNYYGSITTQTGAYIEFNTDGSFNCILGFLVYKGTYTVSNGDVSVHTTQEMDDANEKDINDTQVLGWETDDTILYKYTREDGVIITNVFRQE